MSVEISTFETMGKLSFDPLATYNNLGRTTVGDVVRNTGDLIIETYAHMAEHKAETATALLAAAVIGTGVVAVKEGVGVGTARAATAAVAPDVVKTNQNGTELTETSTSTVLVGKSSSSASAIAKIKVWGNYRTVSRAKINAAKKRGDCEFLTGAQAIRLGIRTQGYNGSGTGYALENRPTLACDTNGDGKWDTRGQCGNDLIDGRPQPKKAKTNLWVNNFNKFDVGLRTKVSVEALSACKIETSPGKYVSASSRGFAEATASGKISFRSAIKAGGKGVTEILAQQRANLAYNLGLEAAAEATTECVSKGGTVEEEKPPVVPPKDGTPGAGNTIPGPIGGEAGPTTPGNSQEGVVCFDSASKENGDMLVETDGVLLHGKVKDRDGNCVGAAEQLV